MHGSYHQPLGLLAAVAAAGGAAALRGRRLAGAVAGGVAFAAMWEDLTGGWRRPLRRILQRGSTTVNVVAEAGDPRAERTLVLHAHHDAARTSFIFDPTAPRLMATRLPRVLERMDRWPALMRLVAGGPLLVAVGALLGSRRATATGAVMAGGTAAVMADMARNPVVPGANDNLTGVAVLIDLARRLREHPVEGLRVLLVSMGAEEANEEGSIAFARRHFPSLAPETTSFLCLDTVGSPELILIEGEGFLTMREYPEAFKGVVEQSARDAGVHLRRGLRLTFATDGLIPLRAGYACASVGSVNEYMVPSNYHSLADIPENVDYARVADAVRLSESVVRRLAHDTGGSE